ncbi:reverse transcriptase domain-containing protein [Fluviicola taffensis]|uniref:RNA-directed DNA polymerase (Reverse transcriptase) n=1 Tax=Fluviicola taffensis (strain DSM 16823 / NCIMB 13979 / RW262) TaxID=755732 RepID=F2IGZ5_FLUTR|nr:reverse transcriptase domain-containing protein [Fluviicola taffensis]AEA44776.1 RNA-directed DNA polymerase (Reverse transcriptase) [Fluviicola taffensis DSM 16823]
MELPDWFKIKGYYHISPQTSGSWKDYSKIEAKLKSKEFVANYAFYPLLHTIIDERKFKKIPNETSKRAHSFVDENGVIKKNVKKRPLHYANHFDALIMAYYAEKLQEKYDEQLKKNLELDKSVTAYRKIPVDDTPDKNKGNIHFAKEVFDEIKMRVCDSGDTIVMAFDIKSFFSTLNHGFLYKKWAELINEKDLPADHLNVFKAATKFSFIYKNDLKRLGKGPQRKYDEKRLAEIRNKNGFRAYFESPKDFRTSVKKGEIHIFQNNFKNEAGEQVGIPQGLPISALLANLYLLDFDKTIIQKLVDQKRCYYRRYSDDIIVICSPEQTELVNQVVTEEMKRQEVIISTEKTEVFRFQNTNTGISVFKKSGEEWIKNQPLNYLGFEFYGTKTLIKSTNISKFYRRMIYAVKNKSKLALKIAEKEGDKPILFKRQLYRIYRNVDLDHHSAKKNFLRFEKRDTGEFQMISDKSKKKPSGNYFTYAERAAEIMDEPAIIKQVRNEKKIFNQALDKYFHSKRKK